MCLLQRRLFKTTQSSKQEALCACSCNIYSTFWFLTLRSSPLTFNKKSNALVIQSSPSITKVSFLRLSISYCDKSWLYLPANLLNLQNEIQYGLALPVLRVSMSEFSNNQN